MPPPPTPVQALLVAHLLARLLWLHRRDLEARSVQLGGTAPPLRSAGAALDAALQNLEANPDDDAAKRAAGEAIRELTVAILRSDSLEGVLKVAEKLADGSWEPPRPRLPAARSWR